MTLVLVSIALVVSISLVVAVSLVMTVSLVLAVALVVTVALVLVVALVVTVALFVTIALVLAIAVKSSVLVVVIVLLGHESHKGCALVCLIRGPTGQAVGLHRVATNISVLDTVVHVVPVLVEVDEGVLLVHGVGHGRTRMWVWDIMAAIVVTTVHSIIHILGHLVVSLVLGLVNGSQQVLVVVNLERLEVWLLSVNNLLRVLAGTVGTNTKVLLNFEANDGPLGGGNWPVVTTEVVVNEELVFITCLALGEHWVNDEDWRSEHLAGVVDGLHVVGTLVKGSDLWSLGNNRVLDGLLRVEHCQGYSPFNMLSLLKWSLVSLPAWGGEVGQLTLQVAIGVRGLAIWVVMVVALTVATEGAAKAAGKASLLHQSGQCLRGDRS